MTLLDLIPGLKARPPQTAANMPGLVLFAGAGTASGYGRTREPRENFGAGLAESTGTGFTFLGTGTAFPTRTPAPPGGHAFLAWNRATDPGQDWDHLDAEKATSRGTPGRKGPGSSLQACQKNLAGPSGPDCRAFLTGRGLKLRNYQGGGPGLESCRQLGEPGSLGPTIRIERQRQTKESLAAWGSGHSLLCRGPGYPPRVRRPDPGDGPRYVIIPGVASVP